MLVVEREAPEFGVAGFAGGVEDDVGVVGREGDAFGFVDQVRDVLREEDALRIEIYDVKEELVGRVAVREVGIATADDAALPDVDAFVDARLVEDVGVGQVDLAAGVGIGQARQTELLEQLVVAVAAAVGVEEAIFGVKTPVDGAGVVRPRVEDLLDDPAAFQRDVGHVAAVGPAAGSDVEQGELGLPRSLLHAEAGIVTVRGVPLQLEVVHQLLLFHVEDADMPFVMQHEGCSFQQACDIIGRLFGIWGDAPAPSPVRRVQLVEPSVAKEPTYIPMDYVEQHLSVDNSFCQGLRHLFDFALVQHLAEEYRLGCLDTGVHPDSVLFPNIDLQGRVRNVKVQHYGTDPASPNFLKSDKRHCFWIGKQLVKQGLLPADAEFDNECLFGEHLLPRYPMTPVILVESPKNALVGAAAFPQFLWVATGNKGMLKRNVLSTLRGRTVLVYPDRDAIEEWEEKLCHMQDIASFRVSHLCEQVAPADQPKYDIADFIISHQLA